MEGLVEKSKKGTEQKNDLEVGGGGGGGCLTWFKEGRGFGFEGG
jgi:hypothetical protein